jgi:DNA-binding MarR family transcriptional regulator
LRKRSSGATTGAELLDVVVRLNRWATHQTAWDVPLAQVRVLSHIDQWGRARVTDLARAEPCSQPTMTARVQALAAQGWLARAIDPDDARSALLTLTQTGKAVLAKARGSRARVIDALLEQMDAGQRERIEDATTVLHALLEAAYADTPDSTDPEKS